MADHHNIIVAASLLLVAAVGIAGLYFSTAGPQEGGVVQSIGGSLFGGGIMITGADTAQLASADFNVTPTINIQFKSFTDSNSIAANITPNQTTLCNFMTAVGNETQIGNFTNGTGAGGYPLSTRNLTPSSSGCEIVYSTVSEVDNGDGAFGVENLGNVDLRVNASDASGCVFGESAPASCIRQIVANQQGEGDCNTTVATNFCIRTVSAAPERIQYVSFNSGDSPVVLCDNLDIGGGLEIDLNYTFTISGVPPGIYIDSIDFIADNVTDAACDV